MVKTIFRNVLLTGAGFTKKFGGFLATEMWAQVFNHPAIQQQPCLRKLLLEDFDYESIYHRVIEGNYDTQSKGAIRDGIRAAYENLDQIVLNCFSTFDRSRMEIKNGFWKLVNCCAAAGEIFLFFTTNQDLFVERYPPDPGKKVIYPFFKEKWALTPRRDSFIDSQWISLPNEDEIKKQAKPLTTLERRFCYYVKLHGSYGWRSWTGADQMVIGRDKNVQIAREPLLRRYFEVFKEVLSQGKMRLWVIGYGFRDEHINKVIADAIEQNQLGLYVISPRMPEGFVKDLLENEREYPQGRRIISGPSAYFPYALADIFPVSTQAESQAWKQIQAAFIHVA